MSRIVSIFLALLVMSAGLSLSTPASAQATRTWVSGVGDDVNPCSRTAPCKTFAGAISKTAAGGEINCLDPGGWGTVTITKAMTIDCSQFPGSILNSSTTGVVINAGATDDVVLRGLEINGGAPGTSAGLQGVNFLAGASLTLKNVVIRNQTNNGINFQPSTTAHLAVINTLINRTGTTGSTFAGIQLRPTGSGNAKVSIHDTQILNGVYGIVADGTGTTGKITGELVDSVISGNSQNGITASIGTSSGVTLVVEHATVSKNGNNGLAASGANAGMLVGNSTIYGNGGGVFPLAGSAIVSYGTNRVNGNNANDGAFTSVIAQK